MCQITLEDAGCGDLVVCCEGHMGVSLNGGTPKTSHFNRVFHCKPSILGYHYFWKHPWKALKFTEHQNFFQMTENDITLPNWGKGISTLHFLLAFQSFQKGDHGWSPPDFGDAMTTDIEPFMMSNPRIIMETLMEQHTQRLPSLIALNRLV